MHGLQKWGYWKRGSPRYLKPLINIAACTCRMGGQAGRGTRADCNVCCREEGGLMQSYLPSPPPPSLDLIQKMHWQNTWHYVVIPT